MRLGYAAGKVLAAAEQAACTANGPAVLIGKDTRISGYMLESALQAGLTAAGVDVRLTGPMPTPGVAYLTRALRLQAGVVISASHNPFEDNGIKFFSARGTKLPDDVELAIEAALDEPMKTALLQAIGSGQAGGRRRRALHRVLQEHLSHRHGSARHAHRGRLRQRRRLSHRPARVP
jgi:phosphoglucosamine mutase